MSRDSSDGAQGAAASPQEQTGCPVCGTLMWTKNYGLFLDHVAKSAGAVFQHDDGRECVLQATDQRYRDFVQRVRGIVAAEETR